jgi:hypothetical protein
MKNHPLDPDHEISYLPRLAPVIMSVGFLLGGRSVDVADDGDGGFLTGDTPIWVTHSAIEPTF